MAAAGWQCTFATVDDTLSIVPEIDCDSYTVLRIPAAEYAEAYRLKELMNPPDCVVIDHYGLGEHYEHQLRQWAKMIVVLDDEPNRPHDADLLIDQTFERSASEYKQLVPESCALLCGASFALLDTAYSATRESSIERRKAQDSVSNILISFGYADQQKMTSRALQALVPLWDQGFRFSVDVVIGTVQQKDELELIASSFRGALRIHVAVRNMVSFLHDADIAIGAAGISSWERACLAVPGIVVTLADNQLSIARRLHQLGAITYIGTAEEVGVPEITQVVAKLMHSAKARNLMIDQASVVCDGLGLSRVTNAIQDIASKPGVDYGEV